jgi:predicted nucleic acid-binding protein
MGWIERIGWVYQRVTALRSSPYGRFGLIVAFLFDTDAISELLRPKPLEKYITWLQRLPRDEQFTSSVVIGELYKGAYRSPARERHLDNIRKRILPAVTVLPYDVATANVYGKIRAQLEDAGQMLADADLQIAATALYHDLELVTGNLRHFGRIDGLRINNILSQARRSK